MKDTYDDIIDLPYCKSDKYPHMSHEDRAAQFAPFSALTGYSDIVDETGRLTDCRKALDEYKIEEINRELQYAAEHIGDDHFVTFVYFLKDKKKSGGEYRTVTDRIIRVDEFTKEVYLSSGEIIPIEDIFSLSVNK